MQQSKNTVSSWTSFTVNHPLILSLFIGFCCGLFFIGLPDFRLNPSGRDYLGQDTPLVKNLIQLEQEYVADINIFVMLKSNSDSVFERDTLAAMVMLTEAAWTIPYLTRVDSLTNFQHTEVDGDDLQVADLVENIDDLSISELARVREIALSEPALKNYLLSESGHAAGINMIFDTDLSKPEQMREASLAYESIKQDILARYPAIQFYESGYGNMTDHWYRAVADDIKQAYGFSLVVIFVSLIFFLGNFRASFAVFFCSVLAVLVGVGALGLLHIELNPSSISSALMILVLGLADGIHITKSVRRLLAEGEEYNDAIQASVASNFKPILLTSLTTAIGFLTFNFSGYDGVSDMGNFVAFGVLVAFVLSISLLPALLLFCGLKPEKAKKIPPAVTAANFVLRHHKVLLWFTVPAIIVAFFCLSLNEFDERITRYLRPSHPFTQNLDVIQEELTGATTIIYNFNSGEPDGVTSPEFMRQIEAFSVWVAAQPDVRHVSSYIDTLKRLNRDLNGGERDYYSLPDSQNLAAQYLLLYELSLPFGLELTNQINLDKSGVRLVLNTNDLSISEMKALIAANKKWMEIHTPRLNVFANSDSVSSLLMAGESIEIIIVSGVLALVIIGCVLLFTFRSLIAGALCVLAVISPILVSYGIWGIFVGRIGLPGALAICMVIGIAVDFSVHFLSKFIHAKRQLEYDTESSIRYAFNLVYGPIMTSVAVLGGGFSILLFSVFEYNMVMGALTALCVFFSAFSALLLVPSILAVERFTVK